jgi:hypothetical protein
MESLPIDEDHDCWTRDEWDMMMGLLGEALVTGHDEGVGVVVRECAVAVSNDGMLGHTLVRLQDGTGYTAWEAFLLGCVAAKIHQARELTPEICAGVLRRWKGQVGRAAVKRPRG